MKRSLTSIILCAIAIALWQCTPKKTEDTSSLSTTNVSLPQLTDQQKAEGWQLLFDGKSMQGWRIFKNRENNTWEVTEGTLHCKAVDETTTGVGDKRSDIITEAAFENFELTLEWKIAKEGNSGIMFRVTEEFEQPYFSGPEFQLMDDAGFPAETPDHLSGANYGMHAPVNAPVKPSGEWNTAKLVVNKNHIEHWLNGSKVVEYEINSSEWVTLKNSSKWKETAGYGASSKGHLVLQDHGSEIWFKNILIKPL